MTEPNRILVAGATGKVGQPFIRRFLAASQFETFWLDNTKAKFLLGWHLKERWQSRGFIILERRG